MTKLTYIDKTHQKGTEFYVKYRYENVMFILLQCLLQREVFDENISWGKNFFHKLGVYLWFAIAHTALEIATVNIISYRQQTNIWSSTLV